MYKLLRGKLHYLKIITQTYLKNKTITLKLVENYLSDFRVTNHSHLFFLNTQIQENFKNVFK